MKYPMSKRMYAYVRSAIVLCVFCLSWAAIIAQANWQFENGTELKGRSGSLGYSRKRGFRGIVLVVLWLLLAAITYQHFGLVFPAIKFKVLAGHGGRWEWNPSTLVWGLVFGAAIFVRFIIHAICYSGYSPTLMRPFTSRDGDMWLELTSLVCVLGYFIIMGYVTVTRKRVPIAAQNVFPTGLSAATQTSVHASAQLRQRWVILLFFELGIVSWSVQSPLSSSASTIAAVVLAVCVLVILGYSTIWMGRLESNGMLGTVKDSYDLAVLMYFGILLMRIVSRLTELLSDGRIFELSQFGFLVELLSPLVFGSIMTLMTLLMDFCAPIVFPRRPAKWMTFIARFAQELFTAGAAYSSFLSVNAIVVYCVWYMASVCVFDTGLAHDLWTTVRGVQKTVVRFQRQKANESSSSIALEQETPTASDKESEDAVGLVRTAAESNGAGASSSHLMPESNSSVRFGSTSRTSVNSSSPSQTRKLTIHGPKSPTASFRMRLGTAATALLKSRPIIPDQALLYAQQIERAQFSLLARLCCISCFFAVVLINPETHFSPEVSVNPLLIVACTSLAWLLPWPLVVVRVLRSKAKLATELARRASQNAAANTAASANGGHGGTAPIALALLDVQKSVSEAGPASTKTDQDAAATTTAQVSHNAGMFTMCRIDLWDSGAVTFIMSMVSMLILCKFGPLDM